MTGGGRLSQNGEDWTWRLVSGTIGVGIYPYLFRPKVFT